MDDPRAAALEHVRDVLVRLSIVAERAMERKTGARGLRSILEGILLESMYTIPSTPDVAKIVVDESVVKGDSEPLLVYETPSAAAAGAEE